MRPADIRCTSSTSSPSSVGNSNRLARRSAPAKRRPSSAESGGSNVFRVAMWAGPACSTGNALTGSFSARRQASISGSSGNYPPAMADVLRVAVRRGTFVESVHEVHGVAVRDGETVASFGDPSLTASLRPSAKPLQALPLARAYPGLGEQDLAIASASHYGTAQHVEAVRRLLAATGGSEDALHCRVPDDRAAAARRAPAPEPIYNNCSGKHAGMLATCRANGWPVEGYRHADHPLQQLLLGEVAAAAELEPGEVGTGIDGCGVVAFAIPLERAARAFARLETLDGGDRIAAAMHAHPVLVGGEGATDTVLMQGHPGMVAKGGADGLLCAGGRGAGLALKVADGNGRALRPALAVLAAELGLPLPEFEQVTLDNRHGEAAAIVALM